MTTVRALLFAVGAGVLLNLAFPGVSLWPLAIAAAVILWFALSRAGAWSGFLIGWAFGMAFLLPHLYWANAAVGMIPWIVLSAAEAAAIGLFGAGWATVRRSHMLTNARAWAQPLAFAVLWTGIEELRSMVPFGGFPWARVAFSQSESPLGHLAWVAGAPLVSFATFLAGGVLALAIEAGMARHWGYAAVGPVAVIAIIMAGVFIPLDAQPTEGKLSVAVVQGNVPNEGLDSFDRARQVTRNHLMETRALMATNPAPLDILIWPENAADYDPRVDQATYDMVTEAAVLANAPLLLGTQDLTPEDGRYNISLLLSVNGTVLDSYIKQRPAPFAEYIPIRDIARKFSDAVDRVTRDMIAGEGPAIIELPAPNLRRSVTTGPVICFEVAYDAIVRQSVRKGAEILIVQTNNASFGMTAESEQQLAMTQLRAIEFGRTAIQASTVGVSAIVLPDGHIVEQTELFEPAHMAQLVPLRSESTPAMYLGGVSRWAALILGALVVFFASRKRVMDRYDWS